MVHKLESQDTYRISSNISISNQGFIDFITTKFYNYTVYLKLEKLTTETISAKQISEVLKETFKGYEFEDKTWDTYSLYLIGWLLMSDVELKTKIIEPKKGRQSNLDINLKGQLDTLYIRSSLKEVTENIKRIIETKKELKKIYQRDFFILGLIDKNKAITDFGKQVYFVSRDEQKKILIDKALNFEKMKAVKNIYIEDKKITAKKLLLKLPADFFDAKKESSKSIYAGKVLTWIK